MRLFRRRGQTPESWYEPRRHDITTAFAVVAGVAGAFYAGATQWSLLSDPDYSFAWSFAKYEGAVGLGALVFAVVGGAAGWAVGEVWERQHRRRRARHPAPSDLPAPGATHATAAIGGNAAGAEKPVVQTSASYDTIPRFGELYDAIPAYASRKDTAFYLDTARLSGGPVLEFGCGTGRILLPIARAGISIVGVDGSRLMLDRCREKVAAEPADVRGRVSLHLSDAATFNSPTRFPLIIAPFRVFQQIVSIEHQLAFLASVARHLAPGGWFVFDLFNPSFRVLASDRSNEATDTLEFALPDGRRLRRNYRVPRVRFLDQVSDTELIYYVTEPGKPTERFVQAFEMRWYTRQELEHLLARAGFRATAVYGDFDRSPASDVSPEIVIRAELATGGSRAPSPS